MPEYVYIIGLVLGTVSVACQVIGGIATCMAYRTIYDMIEKQATENETGF